MSQRHSVEVAAFVLCTSLASLEVLRHFLLRGKRSPQRLLVRLLGHRGGREVKGGREGDSGWPGFFTDINLASSLSLLLQTELTEVKLGSRRPAGLFLYSVPIRQHVFTRDPGRREGQGECGCLHAPRPGRHWR